LALLSGFFSGLALLLTALGLYGLMAYIVTQRTHEIGIRLARGARQGSILRLVMRDVTLVLVSGIAAGTLGQSGSRASFSTCSMASPGTMPER